MNFKNLFQEFSPEQALRILKNNATWYMITGIALIIVGVLAIISSTTATLFSVTYLGVFLIIRAIVEWIQAYKLYHGKNFLMHAAIGLLFLLAGLFITTYPLSAAAYITIMIAAFFVATGLVQTISAATQHVYNTGLFLLCGLLTLALGILIWYGWPTSSLWVIGTLVGIHLITSGTIWVMVARQAQKIGKIEG